MAETTVRRGGFWIRLVGFGLDLVVVMIAQFLLNVLAGRRWGVDADRSAALQGAVVFFTLLFAVLYPTVLYTLTGQTIGKLLVGVRVVATDGGLLPPGAALLRAVVQLAMLPFLLGLGHVLAGLRKDKRALHDLIAGSRVDRVSHVRVRPAPAPPAPPPPEQVPPPAGARPAL
jgi:uncharacterized RDD family membrane protein YckC